MGERIILTAPELLLCDQQGVMRRLVSRGASVVDRQRGAQSPWQIDKDGAVSEWAFAKMANLFPDFTVSARSGSFDFIGPDGHTINVKSTRHKNGKLLGEIKKKDNPADIYVLMVIEDDESATFVGWAWGRE